ncbi:hypothetical protein SDC9_04141 [bioreactor metagenome]|uniref:Uncharacterized protein n=1 Tax=bioreactor metagenome TaxID=1076179 RepID=A0A644SWH2_9ZZZZ|nr:hypothetical protein [Negativicutes bacterium]
MATTKKTVAPAKPERLIYCGPNIPGGILQRYAVYKGGLPAHLKDVFEKCPAIKLLFVPVVDLAKTEQVISTKGTPENTWYQEVLKGGVK